MARDVGRRLGRLVVANKRIVILAACAIVFVALLEDVLEGDLLRIDSAAYTVIVERLRADWLTPVMEAVSALATPVSLVAIFIYFFRFSFFSDAADVARKYCVEKRLFRYADGST